MTGLLAAAARLDPQRRHDLAVNDALMRASAEDSVGARHCGNCADRVPGGPDNCPKCGREQQYSHWTPGVKGRQPMCVKPDLNPCDCRDVCKRADGVAILLKGQPE